MLQWTEQFATGVGQIDHQHQALIDNINQLELLLANFSPSPEEYQFMLQLVNFLEFYARSHFHVEEQCMESFQCPIHAKNKQAHATFLAFFTEFKTQCATSGLCREFIENLHVMVSGWIMEHILRVDTQLKACIKGGGAAGKHLAATNHVMPPASNA
jgi:hemerythrin